MLIKQRYRFFILKNAKIMIEAVPRKWRPNKAIQNHTLRNNFSYEYRKTISKQNFLILEAFESVI